MTDNPLADVIRIRIEELKEIDSNLCQVRWDMSKPAIERAMARETSNQVTFARQELERLIAGTPEEHKQKVQSWDLKTIMETVHHWLNSSDVEVLTEKGGKVIERSYIEVKSGSLLKRLIGLVKYRIKEQMK